MNELEIHRFGFFFSSDAIFTNAQAYHDTYHTTILIMSFAIHHTTRTYATVSKTWLLRYTNYKDVKEKQHRNNSYPIKNVLHLQLQSIVAPIMS